MVSDSTPAVIPCPRALPAPTGPCWPCGPGLCIGIWGCARPEGNPPGGPGLAAGGTPPGLAAGGAGPPGPGGPGLPGGPLGGMPRPGGGGPGPGRLGGPGGIPRPGGCAVGPCGPGLGGGCCGFVPWARPRDRPAKENEIPYLVFLIGVRKNQESKF